MIVSKNLGGIGKKASATFTEQLTGDVLITLIMNKHNRVLRVSTSH
ncbi:MAG: hypothetical protein ACI8RD_004095 [Bacillariaceae sp.]|jgi:hypothetical protein